MKKSDLKKLNESITSLHDENDVYSYEINEYKRIDFPRGFLKTLHSNRSFLTFLDNKKIIENIAQHMMHRDTLHWLWLKTDIRGSARGMIIKFQLINLASILEAIVKCLYPTMPKAKNDVYNRVDKLEIERGISNANDLKKLWEARKSIHLHLTQEKDRISFTDAKYIAWHKSMATLIKELNNGV
jgi:hypothetical protein